MCRNIHMYSYNAIRSPYRNIHPAQSRNTNVTDIVKLKIISYSDGIFFFLGEIHTKLFPAARQTSNEEIESKNVFEILKLLRLNTVLLILQVLLSFFTNNLLFSFL